MAISDMPAGLWRDSYCGDRRPREQHRRRNRRSYPQIASWVTNSGALCPWC